MNRWQKLHLQEEFGSSCSIKVKIQCACLAEAPEYCTTFGDRCIPKTTFFPSTDEFFYLYDGEMSGKCDVKGGDVQETFAQFSIKEYDINPDWSLDYALSTPCEEFRSRLAAAQGCPECADERNDQAAATPICTAQTNKADCERSLVDGSGSVTSDAGGYSSSSVPASPSTSSGESGSGGTTATDATAVSGTHGHGELFQSAGVVVVVCTLAVAF